MLQELDIGDNVAVQNQTGPRPNKWEKTGVIVEKAENRQYVVRMDGSGRCSLRNRRFLKKVQPICADVPLAMLRSTFLPMNDRNERPAPQQVMAPHSPPDTCQQLQEIREKSENSADNLYRDVQLEPPEAPDASSHDKEIVSPATPSSPANTELPMGDSVGPRRSTRPRKPKRDLSPVLGGKTHVYYDLNV